MINDDQVHTSSIAQLKYLTKQARYHVEKLIKRLTEDGKQNVDTVALLKTLDEEDFRKIAQQYFDEFYVDVYPDEAWDDLILIYI